MTKRSLREKISALIEGRDIIDADEIRDILNTEQSASNVLTMANQNFGDPVGSGVDPVASAFDACQIIDEAVLAGHDNMNDLVLHLLVALAPARAALAKGDVGGSKEGQT